jgi:hypothetical protein
MVKSTHNKFREEFILINQSSKSNLIVVLFIFIILAAALLFQFGAAQTVVAQTGCVDPFTGAQCTDTPPTCGLPGLPDCGGNPPSNSPTAVVIYPTRPPVRTATTTSTLTATTTFTPFPPRPTLPTSTPFTVSSPTVTPVVIPTAKPTPVPGFIPQMVLKLPPPPPFLIALAPRPNFEVIKVEITQAIQCLNNPNCADNTVELFVGKPTMVRLYVRISPSSPFFSVSGIGGELCPGVHDAQGCSNPVHSINTITVTKLKSTSDLSYLRGDINRTLNFILPSGWTYGNFTAYVNMNGVDYPLEASFKDNFISQSFQEITSQRLDVMFVPVKSKGVLADLNERWTLHDWLLLAYPTANIQIWQMVGYINNTPDTYDWMDTSGGCGDGWGALLDDLGYYRGSNPQIFYAMVDAQSLKKAPAAGCGRFSGNVAAGEVNTGDRYGAEVAAQEIGHTMQRSHAPGCGAGNPDPNYPISGANLDEYGVDVVRNQVYIPNLSYDFMGYCGDANTKWTSLYTYSAIASLLPDGVYVPGGQGSSVAQQAVPSGFRLAAPVSFQPGVTGPQAINLTGDQPAATQAQVPSTSLYLTGSGSITPQKVNLKRGFFLLGTDSVAPITPDSGPYTFELLDAQGKVLSSLPFKPQEESNEMPGDTGTFHLTIPWVEAARGYQFQYNGTVIASQTADAIQPSVENISSSGGSHWPNTGTVTISWQPVYAGSNPLQYLVQYSRDGGKSWQTLTINSDQPTLDVDAALVAGSPQAQIRVYVSDGFNTGEVVSTRFTVDNKAPDMHIGWTADGAQVMSGNPVFLNGAATDAQDGPISGSDLHWSVDNNALGDGDTLVTSTIGEGEHVITLSAMNAEGLTGTTSIHLTVLPPAPKTQITAMMDFSWSLLLWAIIPAGILLLALVVGLLLRKFHRPVK